jgi:T-complex protein 1 subunit theta
MKNLEAVQDVSVITRTSMGPNGMSKMVINRHGKLFVTNDAATILSELEIVHPAARICVLASEQQQTEFGDATNLVIIICGELLAQAESLLKMGLHPSDIIRGFEKGGEEIESILNDLVCETAVDLRDLKTVVRCLKSAISAKQNSFEDIFAPLVAQACFYALPKDVRNFNVDDVRVAKIVGGGIGDASVVNGVVVLRDSEGTIKEVENAHVAVYQHGFDISKTDMKGTVFIEKATDLENYAQTEEDNMEAKIKAIADAGVSLVVTGGTISEMAMHFFERYKIMVFKTSSKFELRRICMATNAHGLLALAAPNAEERGFIGSCKVQEIGGTKVTIFSSQKDKGIATVVLRGATQSVLDDIERAIVDAVNVYKGMTKDARFVPGAGATEIEVARRVRKIGETTIGQDQYALKKYAEAFESVPRILAENSGMDPTEAITKLYAKHEAASGQNFGINVDGGEFIDAVGEGILDHLVGKQTAIRLATNAAIGILRIDQIIMSKPAGMPMPGAQGGGSSGTMGSMDQDEA